MLQTLLTVVIVLAVCWLAFVGFVWIARPDATSLSDATRLLPDTIRLVRRLATDRTLPRRTRWWIWALLAYLVAPIDIVPDFVPVLGFADDVVITSLVLRHVIARVGTEKLAEYWPGTPDGLATLTRLLRIRHET